MLTGATAQMVYFNLDSVNSNYGGQLPADLGRDDPASQRRTRPYPRVGRFHLGVRPEDSLKIWKFHVDWTTTGNSYLGTGSAGIGRRSQLDDQYEQCGSPWLLQLPLHRSAGDDREP